MLAALLSGALAIGVELEPAYVSYARRCARHLKMLRNVLERLRGEAAKRPIRVCTFGPCTLATASSSWLRQEDDRALRENQVAVFHSVQQRRSG